MHAQTWHDNLGRTDKPKITDATKEDYTKVIFEPDLAKFHMTHLEDDIVALMMRRAYDMAGCLRGVRVYLNEEKLAVSNFKAYVEEYLKDKTDSNGEPLKSVYESVNDRWEVAVSMSEEGFKQVSFVNSIATTKGGRHVDYIADQVVAKLIEQVKKKLGKSSIQIKPFQVYCSILRAHLHITV
jgi:DNA topoisomerase-2